MEMKPAFIWRLPAAILIFVAIVVWLAFPAVQYYFSDGHPRVDGVYQVDLRSLGNFYFDSHKGTINDLPPRVRELDNQKVALIGFMWADTQRTSDFELIHSTSNMGGTNCPALQRVFAHVDPPKTVDLRQEEVRIIG